MSKNILPKFEALKNCFDEKAITGLCLEIDKEYLEYCGDAKELIGTTGVECFPGLFYSHSKELFASFDTSQKKGSIDSSMSMLATPE
jgi:hypothetical protein